MKINRLFSALLGAFALVLVAGSAHAAPVSPAPLALKSELAKTSPVEQVHWRSYRHRHCHWRHHRRSCYWHGGHRYYRPHVYIAPRIWWGHRHRWGGHRYNHRRLRRH